jgi:LacI family gluconate utilization system Gnt-I transcriptional repressor
MEGFFAVIGIHFAEYGGHNRPELVVPDAIRVVREAIARTGYAPNMLAGGLASKRSRLVAA